MVRIFVINDSVDELIYKRRTLTVYTKGRYIARIKVKDTFINTIFIEGDSLVIEKNNKKLYTFFLITLLYQWNGTTLKK